MMAIFITLIVYAQPVKMAFKGRVIDAETKAAIAAASIKVNNLLAICDDDGAFIFSSLKNGYYQITVSCIGYQNFADSFVLDGKNDERIITLKKSSFFLQPLEVKALRASDKAPFTKTNISKEQLAKTNLGLDLPFLLNQTASTIVNSDAGTGIGYTGITIRGVDATRINITLNGIPFNDPESQGTFLVNLPDFSSSVASIQIQRGVGTSTNGTGAFGGAINLSTNEFIANAGGEINNTYGSFNTWKNTVKANSGLINNHFTVDARLSKISSGGYIDRASSNLQSFAFSTAYLNKKSSLRFNVFSGKEKTYQAWYGVPENLLGTNRTFNSAGTDKPNSAYDNETDNYNQNHYQLFFNTALNSNLSFNTGLFYTTGKGYYEQYKADAKYNSYGLPNFTIGVNTLTKTDLIRQLWLDNKFYGQIFSLQYKKNKNNIIVGGGYSTYEGKHYGKIIWATVGIPKDYTWYNLNALKKDANIYAKWQRKLTTKIDAFGDIQYRNVTHTMNGFRDNPTLNITREFNFVNPKIGFTYTKKDWQAYISYAIGNKEPNRNDFEAGAATQPSAERLQNVELGLERKNSRFSYGATLYYMGYSNQLILTGKVNDVGAYTRVNVPSSYRLGIELQGAVVITKWINIGGNISFSKNKIKNFTEYIDNYDNGTQETIIHNNKTIAFSAGTIGAAFINILPLKNVELSFMSKYVGKQYLDNTENKNRRLPAFYTQDIKAIYTIKRGTFKEINIIGQVNNIFNKFYEPNGYTFSYIAGGQLNTENYYYPMAGTNFMIALNIKL